MSSPPAKKTEGIKNAGELYTRCQQRFGLTPDEVMGLLGFPDSEMLQAHGDLDEVLAMVERRLRLSSGRVLRAGEGGDRLEAAIADAERRAWESLGKYRFQEFGHNAELWASLSKASGKPRKNPFGLVAGLGRRLGKWGGK